MVQNRQKKEKELCMRKIKGDKLKVNIEKILFIVWNQHQIPEVIRQYQQNKENKEQLFEALETYCGKPIKNVTTTVDPKWDFYHSLFFVVTVVSTIGELILSILVVIQIFNMNSHFLFDIQRKCSFLWKNCRKNGKECLFSIRALGRFFFWIKQERF